MRKIINGIIYDTDKAILLKSFHAIEYHSCMADFWTEDRWHDLYQTRKGTYFFLHYHKKWLRRSGVRESYDKEAFGIEPTNEAEVKKFLEHSAPDVLIELYGKDLADA